MRTCPVCGSDKRVEIPFEFNKTIVSLLKQYNIQTVHHWYLCKICGNGYQDPIQNEQLLNDYWNTPEQGASTSEGTARAHSSKRLFDYFFPRLQGKKSVLDIGCGHGYLLKEFQNVGFDVFGIDIDQKTKESHNKLEIPSTIGHVEHIRLNQKYDVVFSTNSLYFIQNPVDFLKKTQAFMNDDGYLCISLADMLAHTNKALPGYALAFYPNYDSIDYILSLAGYEIMSKERKLTNILIVCKINRNAEQPKINTLKIYMLIQTKSLRYYLFGLPLILLHQMVKDTFITKLLKKIIKF